MTSERPIPRIDHIMVLLDGPAHQDVLKSDFLAECFGRLKLKKADSSVAGAYSTLGLAGDNTLIELFGSPLPASAPLTGGLVFSFEEPGSSDAARALLDSSGEVAYHHQLVRRAVAGAEEMQPWYHLISVDLAEASPLVLFLNEVTPEYFRSIGAKPARNGALRRRDYLDAVLDTPAADAARLMRDIAGVTVVVNSVRARRIIGALTAFGYALDDHGHGPELRGPDLAVRLRITESERERIEEIQLRLVPGRWDPDGPSEFPFGTTSRLVIEDADTARWSFDAIG